MLLDILLEITNWLSDYDSLNLFKTNKEHHKCLSKYKFKEYYELDNVQDFKYFHNINKIMCHSTDNISQYIWLTHVLIGRYSNIYPNDLKTISKSFSKIYYKFSDNITFILPPKVTFLSFNDTLNINLNNIKYLILPNHFNNEISIPNSVTHLRLGNYFNKHINLTENLEYLWLGDAFDKNLTNVDKLKFLRLGTKCKIQNLFRVETLICHNKYMLPKSEYLTSLNVESDQIINYDIYPNLKFLKLKYHYGDIILPNSLIKLTANQCQINILNINELINLKYMKKYDICTSKVFDIYPKNLLKLELSMCEGNITNLPTSLTSLLVLSPITINAITPPNLKEIYVHGKINLEKLKEGLLFVSQ